MIEIFTNRKDPIFQGITIQQEFKYAKEYYRQALDKLYAYRAENTWWVDNKNIISRLIRKSIDPVGIEDFKYFSYIASYADDFARELEMSSKYNQGKWFFGNTFQGSSEAYYVTDELFDMSNIAGRWRNLRPIEVMYTDNASLDFSIPDMHNKHRVTIIFKIKPIELFFQYKYWKLTRNSEETLSPNHFIGQYLMPRILDSYLDLSLCNILANKIEDSNFTTEFYSNLPFSISDYSKKIDGAFDWYIGRFKNTKTTLDRLMLNIPMISKANLYEVMKLPQAYFTKQVTWLPLVARIDYIYMMLKLLGEPGIIANTSYTSGIKRYARALYNAGTIFPHNTPAIVRRNLDVKLYKIQEML